jgi:hypothetical protein
VKCPIAIARKPRAETDGGIVPWILVALSERDCFVGRCNSGLLWGAGGRRIRAGFEGAPDIHGFCKRCGAALFLEGKAKRGRLREQQKRFRAMATESPVIYGVPRSVRDAVVILAKHRCTSCRGRR